MQMVLIIILNGFFFNLFEVLSFKFQSDIKQNLIFPDSCNFEDFDFVSFEYPLSNHEILQDKKIHTYSVLWISAE